MTASAAKSGNLDIQGVSSDTRVFINLFETYITVIVWLPSVFLLFRGATVCTISWILPILLTANDYKRNSLINSKTISYVMKNTGKLLQDLLIPKKKTIGSQNI